MRTLWEKLIHRFGTKYSQNTINELKNNIEVNICTQIHSTEVFVRHVTQEALVCTSQSNIQAVRRAQAIMLRTAETSDPSYVELQWRYQWWTMRSPKYIMTYPTISQYIYKSQRRLHMEMNDVPNESKTLTKKTIEARQINWYWDNAHNFCKTIWSRKRLGTPQVPHKIHSSYYS